MTHPAPFLNTLFAMSFRAPTSVDHANRWLEFAPFAGLAFGVATVLASLACGIDSTADVGVATPDSASIDPSTSGTATSYAQSLTGTVTDTDGRAVAGARIQAGIREAMTDSAGRFEIASVPVDARLAVRIAVAKAGFVPLARITPIAVGKTSNLSLVIKRDSLVATLARGSAATVTVSDSGARIIIPSNALVDENGASPATDVDIHFALFNPASSDIKAFPGTSIARSSDGALAVLGSVVMATIEARRGDRRFDIKPGSALTLELPVSAALSPSAGREFSIAWYDAEHGTWEESGTAISSASGAGDERVVYVASISRLGAWSVSLKHAGANDFRCDTVRVVDERGEPLDNVEVSLSQWTKASGANSDLAISSASIRSVAGFANLAPLVREARVTLAARQMIAGRTYAGTVEFIARGVGTSLDSIFVTTESVPVLRHDTACTDNPDVALVLRPEPRSAASACAGRLASDGSCIRY